MGLHRALGGFIGLHGVLQLFFLDVKRGFTGWPNNRSQSVSGLGYV